MSPYLKIEKKNRQRIVMMRVEKYNKVTAK